MAASESYLSIWSKDKTHYIVTVYDYEFKEAGNRPTIWEILATQACISNWITELTNLSWEILSHSADTFTSVSPWDMDWAYPRLYDATPAEIVTGFFLDWTEYKIWWDIAWWNISWTLSDQADLNTALSWKADKTEVLTKTNTTSYTPSTDYNPATKKYVDDTAFEQMQSAIITSASQPERATEWRLWYDMTNKLLKAWDWSAWKVVTVDNTAYASSWNWDSTHSPSKDAVYDKISAMDTTIDGKLDKIDIASSLDRAYIVTASWTQTTYNVSQWASNGAIVRRSGTQIIVPETPTDNTHAASKKYVDDAVAQAWGWDMSYSDFNWQAKTWATITLDLASTYTPSADFTVNAPATIKDWQTYILRVNNESTAYTMTLWTNVTNPFGTDITLTDYWIDQFVFLAIGWKLELQPEWWGWGWAITADTTWTETSISKIWVGTEAEYQALWTYEENVAYMTY